MLKIYLLLNAAAKEAEKLEETKYFVFCNRPVHFNNILRYKGHSSENGIPCEYNELH
jgi:hypothetical protein